MVSVGGFFDIRHKDVAVTFKSLIIMRNRTADAIDHVTLAASKKDLLQVAAFQPLSQQRDRVLRHGRRGTRRAGGGEQVRGVLLVQSRRLCLASEAPKHATVRGRLDEGV